MNSASVGAGAAVVDPAMMDVLMAGAGRGDVRPENGNFEYALYSYYLRA